MRKLFVSSLLASMALAGAAHAQFATATFETDESANFVTTIAGDAGDSNANFLYDSSTYTPGSGTAAITIGPAPTGSSTTKVLRLNCNLAVGTTAADAVAVYPNVTGLGANWIMQFDAWQHYNGPAGGGSGSTNLIMFGATSANTVTARTQTTSDVAGDGFWFGTTGEGGALQNFRFYAGTGTVARNDAGPAYLNLTAGDATGIDGSAAGWTTLFPSPTYETAGSMGKAWTTFKVTVTGTNVLVEVKPSGAGSFSTYATFSGIPATSVKPFVGFSDLNAGLASPVSDQFVLIDNLSVTNVVAGVDEWSVY